LGLQPKKGGRSHPKLNTSGRPIAKKYSDGKVKRTLKRRSKVLETVKRETNGTRRRKVNGTRTVLRQRCGRKVRITFYGRSSSRDLHGVSSDFPSLSHSVRVDRSTSDRFKGGSRRYERWVKRALSWGSLDLLQTFRPLKASFRPEVEKRALLRGIRSI